MPRSLGLIIYHREESQKDKIVANEWKEIHSQEIDSVRKRIFNDRKQARNRAAEDFFYNLGTGTLLSTFDNSYLAAYAAR